MGRAIYMSGAACEQDLLHSTVTGLHTEVNGMGMIFMCSHPDRKPHSRQDEQALGEVGDEAQQHPGQGAHHGSRRRTQGLSVKTWL